MRSILSGLVLISFLSGFSQTPVKVLKFEEAVTIGLRNNVLFNIQKNNLEYSQMQKMQSIAGMGPNISLNGNAARIDGNSFNPNTGTVVNGIRDNVTGSINANINLFSGLRQQNLVRQYANALDAQTYFVNRTSQDVINTVANQYLRVMLDVELVKIAKENFDALAKQLDQVKEQVNLGARGPVDEHNQDAQTKAAELRYIQAQITLNNDKAVLAQTILIDALEDFDVEKPSWDLNEINNESLNPESLADEAKQFRGDYLRAEKQEAAQRYAMNAARGFMMPTLFAFGTFGSAYNFQHDVADSIDVTTRTPVIVYDATQPTGLGIQEVKTVTTIENPSVPRPFSEQFRTNNVYKQYGLQLTIPIFSGLQNRSAYKQQKVLYENATINRKNVEFQIRNDVIRTVRNFEGAKKAYAVSVDQVNAAEMALSLERERYNLGVTNFVDFANANRAYVQAQTDKAAAEYTLVFQRILLQYAVGTLKTEDLTAK